MKKMIYLLVNFFGVLAVLALSNCGKPHQLKPNTPPPVLNPLAMYPASLSLYQGGQSAYPTVSEYTYDKDYHLTWYGTKGKIEHEVNAHQTATTTFDYGSNNQPLNAYSTTYSYSLTGQNNTAVDIYSAAPNQVAIDLFHKDYTTGVTTSNAIGLWQFLSNKDGQIQREITSDGGGRNYNFEYDDNKNLKTISFVSLTGPRAGAIYSRLRVTGVDNHPSPFSNVKGYATISYPQAYPEDYALAFCKNNPTQIITEDFDVDKNAFVPYEQDDFTYTYNDQGYPVNIVESITYFTAVTTHYTYNYTYTYK